MAQVQEQMRHGKTLPVTAIDRSNQATLAFGKLQTIDDQIDTTTGTLKLRAVFANKTTRFSLIFFCQRQIAGEDPQ